MKRKIASILLCMTLSVGLLTGCGTAKNNNTNKQDDTGSNKNLNMQDELTNDNKDETEKVTKRTVYVSAQWLKDALDGKKDGYDRVVVLHVGYDEQSDYEDGHIPGAIYVDIREVEDAIGDKEYPYNLLSAKEVEKNLLSHGITKDTKLVLYGDDESGTARQAFAYIWLGVEDVKILNGGLDAWEDAGFDESETKENKSEPATDFGAKVPAHPEYCLSMEDVKDRLANDDNFKLVSIRSEQEWLGQTSGYSYIKKAGEPEGAVWGKGALDSSDMSGYEKEDDIILTLSELQKVTWADVDFSLDNDLAFYCGTGWRACIPFLICYQEGFDNVAVYDGGWYEWTMYDDNPVQVGDPNSDNCLHTTVGELPNDKAAK